MRIFTFYGLPVTLFFQCIFSSALFAQEEIKDSVYQQKEDVVVVGTRASEKIIDIPYSVFRVDKKELGYGKKVSAKDVLADVPGLFLQNRYGNHDLRVSIRGFGTRSNSGIRGVRILQDGIPESEPDGETVIDAIDFTSLGGVEVVKGNLSSLYANAPGGVINFISDISFRQNYFAYSSQAGSHGYLQNGFKLGLKNNENRFLLTYNYSNLDGYRTHSRDYRHLINAIYQAFIGTKTTLTISGNYVNGFISLPGSLTKTEFEQDPFMADPNAVTQDYRRITKKGRVAARLITNFGKAEEHELEITGYAGIKELTKTDIENFNLNTRYALGSILRYSLKNEIFGMASVFTAGLDYAYQSGPVTRFDNTGGIRGISIQNQYNESLSNTGIYLLEHLTLLPSKLDLFLSGRVDNNLFGRDVYLPFGYTDTSRSFTGFSPKAGLSYKLTPVIALYTSYGLSYDYPALSEMSNTPLSSKPFYSLNPDLEPQKSGNFELGIKGNIKNEDEEFMKKLFFEVTYFNYLIDDEIVPFIINQKLYFRNAAQTSRQGVEIGFMSEPFEEFELTVNYTITDFKYNDYKTSSFTPSGEIKADYTGNKVPSVPANILNFILVKEFELGENIEGLVIWDCDYISDMYTDDANSETGSGYFYGNIMAGLTFDYTSFSAAVFTGVSNIFDKRYAGFININDYQKRFYETGEPRTYYAGLTLNYKF